MKKNSVTPRQRLHRFLMRRYYEPYAELAIFSCEWEFRHWRWLDRYNAWSVEKFGETAGCNPWWDQAFGRFTAWLSDWRTTLSLWFGRDEWKKVGSK